MKRGLFLAFALLASFNLRGQGTVHFASDNSTPIINSLTGQPVSTSDGIKAALYWAPAGSSNFTQIGAAVNVGVPLPGLFIGGTRKTGTATPGGENARFQVRAWEASYGASFEQAFTAAAQNGRGALVGRSTILQMTTGNGNPPTPPAVLTAHGLQSFQVAPVSLPTIKTLGRSDLGCRFLIVGQANHQYITEFSTNLLDWSVLQTNLLQQAPLEIIDPGATNSPCRFYRTRAVEP